MIHTLRQEEKVMPFIAKILLVILIVLAVIFVILMFVGRKLQKRQVEQQALMEQMAQTVSMLIIDKKKMKLKDAGLPKQVYEQTPKYLRGTKAPVVKAKIGPKIMTLLCDQAVFEILPIKTEVKAVVSGLYITSVKNIRGSVVQKPKKKKFLDRFRKQKA